MTPTRRTALLTVRLSPDELAALRAHADSLGTTPSRLVRQLIPAAHPDRDKSTEPGTIV